MKHIEKEYLLQDRHQVKCLWRKYETSPGQLAYHREYEIHFIKKGSGYYFIKNRKYPFSHNNLVVIKREEIHRFIPPTPAVYIEKGSLYFSPSFINKNQRMKDVLEVAPHIIELNEREATFVEIIFRNIANEIENTETNWEDIVYYHTMLFLSLLKRCSTRKYIPLTKNPVIESVISFIEENFPKDMALSDIAKTFFLSTSHLSHIFKKEIGLGVKQYILQRRIMEAKKLLTDNYNEKVSAIAKNVGFTDFGLFNRSFKKITGMTPSGYRKFSKRR